MLSLPLEDDFERKIYSDMIYSFVSNGTGKTRRELFELVKKVDWLKNNDSYNVIKKEVTDLDIFNVKYKFLMFKENIDASSNKFLTMLSSEGIIHKDHIVKAYNRQVFLQNYELGETLVIIDDFIGTGNTVIDAMGYFDLSQRFVIICHSITKEAITILNMCSNVDLKITSSIVLDDYKTKVTNSHQLNLIEKIGKAAINQNYRYGYGDCGLMITYEGVTPNNTLPMFWYSKYNPPYDNWLTIFNREINFVTKYKLYENIFRNEKSLKGQYYKLKGFDLSYQEYLILIALRLKISKLDELQGILHFDTKHEMNRWLIKLYNKSYLIINGEDIEIIEPINNVMTSIINELVNINVKSSPFRL